MYIIRSMIIDGRGGGGDAGGGRHHLPWPSLSLMEFRVCS